MKLLYFTFFFILTNNFEILAQEISTNIGLDTLSQDRNKIVKLWSNYLKSNPDKINDNPYFRPSLAILSNILYPRILISLSF